MHRIIDAVDRAVAAVDDRGRRSARRTLYGSELDFGRAHLAVLRQMQAPPPTEGEEETTAGPDSALADLNVDLYGIPRLAGLFDRQKRGRSGTFDKPRPTRRLSLRQPPLPATNVLTRYS